MDSGALIVVAGVGFVLLLFWRSRSQRFQRLIPVEQNLQRASHGFALAAFTGAAVYWLYGWHGVRDFVPWLWRDPAHAWPGLLLLVPVGYGLIRLFFGARGARANGRDGLLATRAFVKLAVGLAVTIWLGRSYPWPGAADFWAAAALLAVLGLGAWCVVTGAVRFVLTVGFGGNALRVMKRQMKQRNAPLRAARGPFSAAVRVPVVVTLSALGLAGVWFFW